MPFPARIWHTGKLPVSAAPILEIRNLSCAIAGRLVLRDVSLTVAEGETVVLLGRSGSGSHCQRAGVGMGGVSLFCVGSDCGGEK